jgi:hypothetical protein
LVLEHWPAQYENPLLQTHVPTTQDEPPVHALLQVPQWSLLVETSTHTAPHMTCPPLQEQTPATQALPPVQAFLQPPQSLLSVCVSTHDW